MKILSRLRLHLRLRFFISLLPMICLPMLLVGTLSYYYMRETSLRLLENQVDLTLHSVSAELLRTFSTARKQVDILVESTKLRDAVAASGDRSIADSIVNDWLQDYRRSNPGWRSFQIVRRTGDSILDIGEDVGHQQQYAEFLRQLLIRQVRRSEEVYFSSDTIRPTRFIVARKIGSPTSLSVTQDLNPQSSYLVAVYEINDLVNRLRGYIQVDEIELVITNLSGRPLLFSNKAMSAGELEAVRKIASSGIGHLREVEVQGASYLGGFLRLDKKLLLVGLVRGQAVMDGAQVLLQVLFWCLGFAVILTLFVVYGRLNYLVIQPLKKLKMQLQDLRNGRDAVPSLQNIPDFADLESELIRLGKRVRMDSERMKELSQVDLLTGLPDRSAFNELLDKAVGLAGRLEQVLAVMYIDIKDFRKVNDRFGVEFGNKVLLSVGDKLQNSLRLSDEISRQVHTESMETQRILVRTGGDEFTTILRDIKQAYQASVVAERLIAGFTEPFAVEKKQIKLDISIGIALFPVDGLSADIVLKRAEIAMCEAKQSPDSCFRFFTHAMNASTEKRISMEKAIQRGLSVGEFKLELQPRVNLSTGLARDFEAMLRWQHPEMGRTLPNRFLPVAEESGQMVPLGMFVLDEVCRAIVDLRSRLGTVRVALNITAKQIFEKSVLDALASMMRDYKIRPGELELEFSEDFLEKSTNSNELNVVLAKLSGLGIGLTLNNFGIGTTSLTLIHHKPFGKVKIAKDLTAELEYSQKGVEVVRALVNLTRTLDLSVVVQGISTAKSLALVKDLEVNLGQGDYLQPAVALDDVVDDYRAKLFDQLNRDERRQA